MSKRSDTCPGQPCPFWKRYGKYCPFYVEGNQWETPKGHTYKTNDCAPKRSMILTQELYDRTVGIQKSNEQQRNLNAVVLKHVIDSQPISHVTMKIMDAEYTDAQKKLEE